MFTAVTTYLMMEVISMNINRYILAISRNTLAWNTMKYTDEFSHFESLHSCMDTVSTASRNTLTLQYCSVINIVLCF